jgi:hypothetical protein
MILAAVGYLSPVVGAVAQLEMQFDEMLSYLDRDTGEVYRIPKDVVREAEEDDGPEHTAVVKMSSGRSLSESWRATVSCGFPPNGMSMIGSAHPSRGLGSRPSGQIPPTSLQSGVDLTLHSSAVKLQTARSLLVAARLPIHDSAIPGQHLLRSKSTQA